MARYAAPVEDVVRTIGNALKCGTVYETTEQVSAVIHAVDCGLCRLVEDSFHAFRLFDSRWNVMLGIELTSLGKEFVGTQA